MVRTRGIAVAVALTGALSCHPAGKPPAAAPSPPAPARPAPAAEAAPPRHTHENLNAVLWMQTAAEYRATTVQAYRVARLQLDAALRDARWTAAVEQSGDASGLPPALILDLDETVLDNSAFQARQVEQASPYSEPAWQAWADERKAGAVPGAVEFLQYARSRGVTPFYITNRDHRIEAATRDDLARLNIPVDSARDTVLTRGEEGWTTSDKSPRRRAVADLYRILLLVGDNFEDFVPGARASIADRAALMGTYEAYWGTKWIMLPNPTYGSWESAILFGRGPLPDAQQLEAKYQALRTAR